MAKEAPKEQEKSEQPLEAVDETQGGEDTLESLAKERDELKEKILRMAAEHENYKKRSEREKSEFLKRANESLVGDLLPVLDNLERALDAAEDSAESSTITEGLSMIHSDLLRVLGRHGLESVESLGQPFDPEFHEAMMQQDDPDQPANTVIHQMQKGYLFQNRLLRPAMVVVSRRPPDQDDDGEDVEIVVN